MSTAGQLVPSERGPTQQQPSGISHQPSSSSGRVGPRDSAALRQQLAARAPLLSCERLLFSDNPMAVAAIATEHCPASEVRGDACYLLSQDKLAGSHRALDCLALRRERGYRNLPAFHAWGFVAPGCWSYVETMRRAFRPPTLVPPGSERRLARLARDAVQGWAHPDGGRRLRVAVLGSCLPFLLDDVPHLLGQGDVRHDAVSTTITRLRGSFEETRHVSVVGRVVVGAGAADALARARLTHAAALNPLVTGVDEVEDAHVREFRRLRRTVRGAGTVLLLNVVVIALNTVVIWRGMWIWKLIQQLELVQWVQKASPHFPVTMRAIRVLDVVTLPFRAILGPLARPAEVQPRRTAGRALRTVGRGLRTVGETAGRGLRSATGGGASIAPRRHIDV